MFDNLAGSQAGGADIDPLRLAVDQGTDPLKVRHKTPLGSIIGMGNVVAEHRLLSKYFTYFCHSCPQFRE